MRRTTMIILAVTISVGALSGCSRTSSETSAPSGAGTSTTAAASGASTAEYCEAVEELGDLAAASTSAELIAKARRIAEVAPADIRADWVAFADASEAGLDLSEIDFSNPDTAIEELQGKTVEAQQNATKLTNASTNIGKHITRTCK
ncbi:hypothetical protein [Nocardia otitidiscaviarum]|uniref:Lipoprotein n=1 Tax=Nocardia otitidiscaviarum TaxID=1823 RepID=A0A516NQF2_9NOCA|nr:hypothetical protein [Nocardia otitidiscaviarum]MBF6182038.1 hypothetical protein [Nocardia otitidiscaviarum]MCP9620256.1 hypothetical protein [Nocardia otitidiscaviarum]QDP81131.1 hypothetical protein FOH10_22820 [Nocardia otitidiscaviarum]